MQETILIRHAELRGHLRRLLASGESHATNHEVLDDFPLELQDRTVAGFDHTAWQVLEHMRFAQSDILQFCVDPLYRELTWPDDYWSSSKEPEFHAAWMVSHKAFFADLDEMQAIVADEEEDLFARITWGSGQTILREAMLLADHNSYHLGQILTLRKALGAWG